MSTTTTTATTATSAVCPFGLYEALALTNTPALDYAPRHQGPQEIPDKPPYTAHLGNLSYDATIETVTEFFQPSEVVSVRIIEDRETQRPKGFAYAEFKTPDGLRAALELDGTSFQNRPIRIKIADPRMCFFFLFFICDVCLAGEWTSTNNCNSQGPPRGLQLWS